MYTICALYKFVPIADNAALKAALLPAFQALDDLRGTLLLAPEGINGTLCGRGSAIDNMLDILRQHIDLTDAEIKYGQTDQQQFKRLKLRLKRETITFNEPSANPMVRKGAYVAPKDWNALIARDDVLVLDTRNDYEVVVGTFDNAVDPQIQTFTQFKDYVREKLDPKKHSKVAMFCTGGIRCEKASAFMLNEGFEEVYHLKGGILQYLQDIPPEQSTWNGDCFVFYGFDMAEQTPPKSDVPLMADRGFDERNVLKTG